METKVVAEKIMDTFSIAWGTPICVRDREAAQCLIDWAVSILGENHQKVKDYFEEIKNDSDE